MLVSFFVLAQLLTLMSAGKCGESIQCHCSRDTSWIVCANVDSAPIFTLPVKELRPLHMTTSNPENFDYNSLTKTYGFKRVNLIMKIVDPFYCHYMKISFEWVNCYDLTSETAIESFITISGETSFDQQTTPFTSGSAVLGGWIKSTAIFWIWIVGGVFIIIVIMVIILLICAYKKLRRGRDTGRFVKFCDGIHQGFNRCVDSLKCCNKTYTERRIPMHILDSESIDLHPTTSNQEINA